MKVNRLLGHRVNPIGISCLFGLALFSSTSLIAQGKQNNQTDSFLPEQVHAVSTVPSNGDLNPYGVAFVPHAFPAGIAKPGDILVSNFNNSQNVQGTGSTIVDIPSSGPTSVFFQGNAPLGLTTALNILKKGLVLVGSFPSLDGTCANAGNGSIVVINSKGQAVQTLVDKDFINGPWNSALFDQGDKAKLFLANALTGAIVRFDLSVSSNAVTVKQKTTIASGYQHECDLVTFVDAPTGLVYDAKQDVLYVASTMDNEIFVIPKAGSRKSDAGRGIPVYSSIEHLHGPLAMMRAPNGHFVVSNNDAINPDPNHVSALTEFTRQGKFIKEITVDSNPGGAFGLNVATSHDRFHFAAVDDNQNLLLIWTLPN